MELIPLCPGSCSPPETRSRLARIHFRRLPAIQTKLESRVRHAEGGRRFPNRPDERTAWPQLLTTYRLQRNPPSRFL